MKFYKYQGTGNDFIMIDNRMLDFQLDTKAIAQLCHRRFGIGADGLILLEKDPQADFKMVYYNADGSESTMCGNGGRCLVAFAHFLEIFKEKCTFSAIDGLHEAEIQDGIVKLKMIDVPDITTTEHYFVLNTGSPHYVEFTQNVKHLDVFQKGKEIRNSAPFATEGINVNFVEKITHNQIFVRTYERGVEDETYSCGTGVTASALAIMLHQNINEVEIQTLGGTLKVYAEKAGKGFKNIWLEGPAKLVFTGGIS